MLWHRYRRSSIIKTDKDILTDYNINILIFYQIEGLIRAKFKSMILDVHRNFVRVPRYFVLSGNHKNFRWVEGNDFVTLSQFSVKLHAPN